ncbi:MAG: anhydro-N-acetylmuramic acid kinase, partial [Chitinispirillia bacterium]
SNINSGLQTLLVAFQDTEWKIKFYQSFQYPPVIKNFLKNININQNKPLSLLELAEIDNIVTSFICENTHSILEQSPKLKRNLDLIILKKISLWKGRLGDDYKPVYWNIPIGDAQLLSYSFSIPVLTDFKRQNILDDGFGILPGLMGDIKIAELVGKISVFVNIGLKAKVLIIDSQNSKIIVDSETGPGTILIDSAADEMGCLEGFDRDGKIASKGVVDIKVLESLVSDPWFQLSQPKHTSEMLFKNLMQNKELRAMHQYDKLATLTAFTALTIYNFYKKEYPFDSYEKQNEIWISGGGSNNLALCDFLKSYFSPITIKKVEEIDIPNNSKSLLSLGITVNNIIDQIKKSSPGSRNIKIERLGKWIFPY